MLFIGTSEHGANVPAVQTFVKPAVGCCVLKHTYPCPAPSTLSMPATVLANACRAGDSLALNGPLGAGKTSFTQALAVALGIAGPVTSPTFTGYQLYTGGRLPLLHADAYQIAPEAHANWLDGLLDIQAQTGALLCVEWAAMLEDTPAWTWQLEILPANETRLLTLTGRDVTDTISEPGP